MKSKDWVVPLLLFAGIFLLCLFAKFPPKGSADLAAWVQAVGSIGAIIGAFSVAKKQAKDIRNHELEVRRLDRVQRLEGHKALLKFTVDLSDAVVGNAGRLSGKVFFDAYEVVNRLNFEYAVRSLDSIPFNDLVLPESMGLHASILARLHQIQVWIQLFSKLPQIDNPESYAEFKRGLEGYHGSLKFDYAVLLRNFEISG